MSRVTEIKCPKCGRVNTISVTGEEFAGISDTQCLCGYEFYPSIDERSSDDDYSWGIDETKLDLELGEYSPKAAYEFIKTLRAERTILLIKIKALKNQRAERLVDTN